MTDTDDATPIDKNVNDAVYHRPPWMTDAQWQHASAEMTEKWLTLLDEAARPVDMPLRERRATRQG